MPRRQLPETTDNHERWLISYADFITLLFAFFVVMYSTSSSRNELENFRLLSDSIVRAFTDPNVTLDPIDDGKLARSAVDMISTRNALPEVPLIVPLSEHGVGSGSAYDAAKAAELENISRSMEAAAAELPEGGFDLQRGDEGVELALPSRLLFPSGTQVLLANAVPLLETLAAILRDIPNEIRVEGYTDDQPVLNGRFDSNWELSSAQATAVVRELEAQGVDPARLSATGFGEHRPSQANDTDAGREANRRVVLVIQSLAADEQGLAANASDG